MPALDLAPGLDAAAAERLRRHVTEARAFADRRNGNALASVTVVIPASIDSSATVLAARTPGERFFCFEQHDRDGYAVCGLGTAQLLEAQGPERFAAVAGGLPRRRHSRGG